MSQKARRRSTDTAQLDGRSSSASTPVGTIVSIVSASVTSSPNHHATKTLLEEDYGAAHSTGSNKSQQFILHGRGRTTAPFRAEALPNPSSSCQSIQSTPTPTMLPAMHSSGAEEVPTSSSSSPSTKSASAQEGSPARGSPSSTFGRQTSPGSSWNEGLMAEGAVLTVRSVQTVPGIAKIASWPVERRSCWMGCNMVNISQRKSALRIRPADGMRRSSVVRKVRFEAEPTMIEVTPRPVHLRGKASTMAAKSRFQRKPAWGYE